MPSTAAGSSVIVSSAFSCHPSGNTFLGVNLPANRGFANNCQYVGLELDHIRFGCFVQTIELSVTLIRQQVVPELDYARHGCAVQTEEVDGVLTRQQDGLYLDS